MPDLMTVAQRRLHAAELLGFSAAQSRSAATAEPDPAKAAEHLANAAALDRQIAAILDGAAAQEDIHTI